MKILVALELTNTHIETVSIIFVVSKKIERYRKALQVLWFKFQKLMKDILTIELNEVSIIVYLIYYKQ